LNKLKKLKIYIYRLIRKTSSKIKCKIKTLTSFQIGFLNNIKERRDIDLNINKNKIN